MTSNCLIPSFGRRRGRKLRASRQALMDELLPKLQIGIEELGNWGTKEKLSTLFPQFLNSSIPQFQLEIGFGGGEHLAAQASANPQVGFIGCEPYVDGVASLLAQLHEHAIQNVRLFTDDARLLIEQLPDACLERVFILFPDPWPKARHHKRRLIQQPFLAQLARIMKPGATLRLATDHADYCTWMLEQMLACPHFIWTAECKADWETPPPGWVRTRYQEWAEGEGRKTAYLNFIRRQAPSAHTK